MAEKAKFTVPVGRIWAKFNANGDEVLMNGFAIPVDAAANLARLVNAKKALTVIIKDPGEPEE